MTKDEVDEFVRYLDGAWQPALTDVQSASWSIFAQPLDTKAAFTVLAQLFKTAVRRPSPPEFREVYRAEMRNSTPIAVEDEARDEMPLWVRGWRLSREEGDFRLWPEEKEGFRECHEIWREEIGSEYIRRHQLKSGYEWGANVEEFGAMPAKDRAEYMRRAKESLPARGEEFQKVGESQADSPRLP